MLKLFYVTQILLSEIEAKSNPIIYITFNNNLMRLKY
jgi:hypothetical protein